MTVASSNRRRLSAARGIIDLQTGDLVRRMGYRGVGLVEEVIHGFAWVSWKDSRKDYLPICVLRKVRACGHEFDARPL